MYYRVSQAEAALIPLRASSELLKQDVSYGRFSGKDLKTLRDYARKLTVRCDGLSFFYRIIDPLRIRFPQTPAVSRPGTPMLSRPSSRLGTPDLSRRSSALPTPTIIEHQVAAPITDSNGHSSPLHIESHLGRLTSRKSTRSVTAPNETNVASVSGRRERSPGAPTVHSPSHSFLPAPMANHWHSHSFHLQNKLARLRHHRLHIRTPSLLHEALHHSVEQDVGLFESQVGAVAALSRP